MKWATIAGVALLVLFVARKSQAAADPSNPASWRTIKGYQPGTGYFA